MDVTIHPAPLHGTIHHRLEVDGTQFFHPAALLPGTTDINCNATSKGLSGPPSGCLEALGAHREHAPGFG